MTDPHKETLAAPARPAGRRVRVELADDAVLAAYIAAPEAGAAPPAAEGAASQQGRDEQWLRKQVVRAAGRKAPQVPGAGGPAVWGPDTPKGVVRLFQKIAALVYQHYQFSEPGPATCHSAADDLHPAVRCLTALTGPGGVLAPPEFWSASVGPRRESFLGWLCGCMPELLEELLASCPASIRGAWGVDLTRLAEALSMESAEEPATELDADRRRLTELLLARGLNLDAPATPRALRAWDSRTTRELLQAGPQPRWVQDLRAVALQHGEAPQPAGGAPAADLEACAAAQIRRLAAAQEGAAALRRAAQEAEDVARELRAELAALLAAERGTAALRRTARAAGEATRAELLELAGALEREEDAPPPPSRGALAAALRRIWLRIPGAVEFGGLTVPIVAEDTDPEGWARATPLA